MTFASRTKRLGAAAGAAVLAVSLALFPSSAASPSVAISTVEGKAVSAGDTVRVRDRNVDVTGTSDATPPLVADAGDSSFVAAGTAATLIGSAVGGADPYTFAWSYDGSGGRFADAGAYETTFDTTGLDGPVTLTLAVEDAAGRTATDTVKLFVWNTTTRRVLDETVDAGPGVPDEDALGFGLDNSGAVDGETRHFPIAVDPDTTKLELSLEWTQHQSVDDPTGTLGTVANANDFDLYVDDPSDVQDGNTDGAGQGMPERIAIDRPAAGDWQAIVKAFLNSPDTYHLVGDVTEAPSNPLPAINAGPFSFAVGEGQVLTAEATGGTAPLLVEWDLDRDGVTDTTGTTAVTDFDAGTHLVSVKVTDAAGYEQRQITPVRVGVADANGGIVVVGVSDSGLNVYHRDFRATTFPDAALLERTQGFTAHPSTYIPGYPSTAIAKNLTFDTPFAPGKLYPAQDEQVWSKANTPNNTLFWIPGTKIIGAIDGSDTGPVNGNADATPILDDDGHGTASASVAVGNLYGYCARCLLFFVEGLSADGLLYDPKYDFIDLASNSHGALGNVGFAGLVDPVQSKEDAEKGEIALYAAGNGNENAFVTPEQTYTSESLGPDWMVRVGAVDKSTRKPIVGTGKPVDIASWGYGDSSGPDSLPAASATSPTGTTTHSGTSAATPYSTGVFGTVLGAIRDRLGDTKPGQKNPSGQRAGIIAKGTPVSASPYLADGVLTRTELVDAVFKTAEHDGSDAFFPYPGQTPAEFPAQYLIEGYGIVEPASGLRALDVLLGAAPLPQRPAEDEFFAADTQLRDALWGTWAGGGRDSSNQSLATAGVNPFTGVTAAEVATSDAAAELLAAKAGPFQSDVLADAAAAQAAGGLTLWPHAVGDCNAQTVEEYLDTANSTGDVECTYTGTAGVLAGDVATWSTKAPLSTAIPAGTAVDGVLYLATEVPANTIVTVTVSAAGRMLGQSETEVTTLGALDDYVGVPVEFTTVEGAAVGEDVTVNVTMDLSPTWSFGLEGEHASFFTFATTGGGTTDPGPLGVAITAPSPGTVIDPAATPTVAVSGTASFPAATGQASRYYPFWTELADGTCGVQELRAAPATGDSGCSQTFQALGATGAIEFVESYPLPADRLPITVASGGTVSGVLTYGAGVPDPARVVTVRLLGTPAGTGTPVVLGEQQVAGTVIGVLGLGPTTEFPFSFEASGSAAGVALEALSLDVRTDQGTNSYMNRDDGASYVDIPVASAPTGASVQVSVDDATFAAPQTAALGSDGSWGYTLDALSLADGDHTVYARAVQGTAVSAPASVAVTVRRAAPAERVVVQLQLIPDGAAESATAWINATDTGADFSTWTASLSARRGTYQLVTRLLVDGQDVARGGPIVIDKKR